MLQYNIQIASYHNFIYNATLFFFHKNKNTVKEKEII